MDANVFLIIIILIFLEWLFFDLAFLTARHFLELENI